MNNNFLKFKNYLSCQVVKNFSKNQKGVSLVIAFFIMTIILAVILSITILLYSEIKMIRNIGNSIVAFYAADSGIEKVLYYDRKIISNGDTRGLCSMFSYDAENLDKCPLSVSMPGIDSGLYCNTPDLQLTDPENITGCDSDVCDDCQVSFTTMFTDNEKQYDVVATVSTDAVGYSNLTIKSAGLFRSVSRKIELQAEKLEPLELIIIRDAYATKAAFEGYVEITVVAEIEAVNGVSFIEAHIKDAIDGDDVLGSPIFLILSSGDIYEGVFTGTWTGSDDDYYIDINVIDTEGNRVEEENIQPYPI
jgi:hypothetical protein